MSRTPRARRNPPSILDAECFLILGNTGAGKSSFINCLTGRQELPVSRNGCSQTTEPTEQFCKIDGRLCCFIDTPGFEHNSLPDAYLHITISDWLEKAYRDGVRFTGILHLRPATMYDAMYSSPVTVQRVVGDLVNLDIFKELVGLDAMGNVMFVSTKWDRLPEAVAQHEVSHTEEYFYNVSERYFKPCIERGARTMRHDNSTKSARDVIRKMVGRTPVALKVQEELVEQEMIFHHTAAGMAVSRKLSAQNWEILEAYGSFLKDRFKFLLRWGLPAFLVVVLALNLTPIGPAVSEYWSGLPADDVVPIAVPRYVQEQAVVWEAPQQEESAPEVCVGTCYLPDVVPDAPAIKRREKESEASIQGEAVRGDDRESSPEDPNAGKFWTRPTNVSISGVMTFVCCFGGIGFLLLYCT